MPLKSIQIWYQPQLLYKSKWEYATLPIFVFFCAWVEVNCLYTFYSFIEITFHNTYTDNTNFCYNAILVEFIHIPFRKNSLEYNNFCHGGVEIWTRKENSDNHSTMRCQGYDSIWSTKWTDRDVCRMSGNRTG